MKPETFSIAKYFPVLFLIIFLSFFAHLGNLPLLNADEGAYSEVTREMLANNDFTSALFNDIPFFHKPPLFYWAQAASIKILGLNEFGLRLPSAMATLLWAASIFLFTRRYFDTRSAWYATLFMATSFLVTIIGRAATPEAMLNLFLTLTLFNIYRFYHSGNRRYIYWTFMFAALGVLTKGSIAMLIPVAASFVFFTLKKKWRDFIQLLFNPVGLIVFGLIVVPWYIAEFMLFGEAFLSDLFLLEKAKAYNFNFIGGSLPYYFYPALLLIGLLPNTAFFIKALSRIRNLISDDLIKFMVIWFLIAVLFLPLSQPKSPFSLVYSLPPLFIIMARVTDNFRHSFNFFIWPLLLTAFFCLVPELAPYIMGSVNNDFARTAVAEGAVYFDAYYRITLGAILLLLTALPFINPVPAATKFAIVGLLFVSMIHFLVLPIVGSVLQQPIKSAAILAKRENLQVVTWRDHQPSFNLYAEMITEQRRPRSGDIVFTKTVYLEDAARYKKLYEKHGIILAEILEIGKNNSATLHVRDNE
jgi:4-amino-4-deoxy-L-arabinose transferase-like glycosyltransferase